MKTKDLPHSTRVVDRRDDPPATAGVWPKFTIAELLALAGKHPVEPVAQPQPNSKLAKDAGIDDIGG